MVEDEDDPSTQAINKPSQDNIYTVDEAINKIGFGLFQILCSVFCGLLWVADAMELMILSFLSPTVKCQWSLTGFEEAMITSVVFFGYFLGGFFWGVLFDRMGRKTGLLLVDIVILLFGLLSALPVSSDDSKIPSYPWLLICRFGVGFGAGGSGQAVTYYTEFLPPRNRGVCLSVMQVWWTIGTLFGGVLALFVLKEGGLGWHWYLGLAATPLGLVLFMFPFIPESARFFLVKGENAKALKVIETAAWYNCKEVPLGRLVTQEEKERLTAQQNVVLYSQGTVTIPVLIHDTTCEEEEDSALQNIAEKLDSENEEAAPLLELEDASTSPVVSTSKGRNIQDLTEPFTAIFTNGMWKTTVILMCLWFGAAWLYYGVVLLTTTLLQYNPHCGALNTSNFAGNSSYDCKESQLQTSDYLTILWTSAAELPGLVIMVVTIEVLGRKITLAVEFVISMIGFLLLFMCTSDIVLTFFLGIIRAFTSGAFQVIYVYTPEVYATNSRAVGLGVCTSAARVGAMVTPYVAQVFLHVNDYATLSLYAGSCLVLAVMALLLPIETKGRALHDRGKVN